MKEIYPEGCCVITAIDQAVPRILEIVLPSLPSQEKVNLMLSLSRLTWTVCSPSLHSYIHKLDFNITIITYCNDIRTFSLVTNAQLAYWYLLVLKLLALKPKQFLR